MATDLQKEIAAKLKELGSQKAVVELGYNWGTVSKVAAKLEKGWKPEEEETEDLETGNQEGENKGDGNHKPKTVPTTQTTNLSQASFIRIEPKAFRMTSRIFWDAYEAVTNHWPGWGGLKPDEFLDKYLEITLLQRGILVGGYLVLDQKVKEESDAAIHNS